METFLRYPILLVWGLLMSNLSIAQMDLPADPLIPDLNTRSWFESNTGYSPDPSHFGAYTMEAMQDRMMIGFSSGQPTAQNGALLATFDPQNGISALYQPYEQGIHDLAVEGDRLYIAGIDPCCPDDWSFGNFYTYHSQEGVTKYRNLPNVVHSFGMHAEGDTIYISTGSHTGDFITPIGQIFKSTDQGEHWTHVSSPAGYRIYDIIRFREKLYAVFNDSEGEESLLYSSPDNGQQWSQAGTYAIRHTARLFQFNDQLIGMGADGKSLVVANKDHQVDSIPLNDFRLLLDPNYNVFTQDNHGYLYTFGTTAPHGGPFGPDDDVIYRTRDLHHWETVSKTGKAIMALSYWEDKDWLVFSTRLDTTGLWKIALNSPPLSVREKPAENPVIRLYPNPVTRMVKVDAGNITGGLLSWEMYDLLGKLLARKDLQSSRLLTIDLSGYPDGIYLLKLYGREENFTRKLVKSAQQKNL